MKIIVVITGIIYLVAVPLVQQSSHIYEVSGKRHKKKLLRKTDANQRYYQLPTFICTVLNCFCVYHNSLHFLSRRDIFYS